jgi:hypothetical protein
MPFSMSFSKVVPAPGMRLASSLPRPGLTEGGLHSRFAVKGPESLARSLRQGLFVLVLMATVTGCAESQNIDTGPFAQAERAMQIGDQDNAKTLYQSFLSSAPEHPLAKVARQRILIIDKQRDAVMKAQGGAVPDYVNPLAKVPDAPAAAPAKAPSAPAAP